MEANVWKAEAEIHKRPVDGITLTEWSMKLDLLQDLNPDERYRRRVLLMRIDAMEKLLQTIKTTHTYI